MANSDISICSDALILLGDDPIAAFTENNDAARTCSTVYPRLRKGIIAAHPWRFAMKKLKLSRDASDPISEWSYSHIIPGEALSGKVRALFNSATTKKPMTNYEIFQRRVYSDELEVWADYKFQADEAEWPETFVTLMVWAVAAEIAFAITDQQSAADEWRGRAYGSPRENGLGGQMAIALSLEAQTQGNDGIYADDFLDARMGI